MPTFAKVIINDNYKTMFNNLKLQKMKNYRVEFKVKDSRSARNLSLQGGTESEAIDKLIQQGTVSRDKRSDIVILSIRPA